MYRPERCVAEDTLGCVFVGECQCQQGTEGGPCTQREEALMAWRVGRTVKRTLFLQDTDQPEKGDRLVGLMDTAELAQRVVDAVNSQSNSDEVAAMREELNRRADLIAELRATVLLTEGRELALEESRREMVIALDEALHGQSVARDQSPKEVWENLLGEVRAYVGAHGPEPRQEGFYGALCSVLNFYSVDARVGRPDWLIANVIVSAINLMDPNVDLHRRKGDAEG
jgi:hypothetical protein